VLRRIVKALLNGVCLALASIPAAVAGFGKWNVSYTLFAHCFSLIPGIIGDYLRVAYYRLTLSQCSLSSRISFGSFLAHSDAVVSPGVYIGCYCILGKVSIGERTQIASGVQILSGRHQHSRGAGGEISGSEGGHFIRVTVGSDCWIGASAIVMADVGADSTIGAGAVVTRSIPPGSTAAGVPARIISSATPAEA
jgi:virginiamycin A acetyltransferase